VVLHRGLDVFGMLSLVEKVRLWGGRTVVDVAWTLGKHELQESL
jgi:hypothetical protein